MSRLDDTIADVSYILDCLRALKVIQETGDCNNCEKRIMGCGYVPKPGRLARYNCPFYQKEIEDE